MTSFVVFFSLRALVILRAVQEYSPDGEKTLAAEQRRSAAKRLIWIDVKRDLYGVTRRTD